MYRSNFAPRRRINRFIDCFGFYFALLLGATSIHIDFFQRKVHTALHYKLYAACANVVLVAGMPWCFQTVVGKIHEFEPDATLLSIDRVLSTLSFTAMLWLLVSRWWRERRLRAIAQDFFALDARYNDRPRTQHAAIEQRFDVIFYVKASTFSLVSLSMLRIACFSRRVFNLQGFLLLLFIYSIHNILYCVKLQHFNLLWCACKRFHMQNAQLRETLQRASASSTSVQLTADLGELALLHWRLVQLLWHLNDSNKYFILPLLWWNLIHNVLGGYHMMRSSVFGDASDTGLQLCLDSLAFAVFFVDENLFLWLCDDLVCVQKETAEILKEFNALPLTDGDLKRQCELFALQLKLRQPQINISGMFNLNNQSALAMWAYILQNILILVQFMYEALET